MERNVYTVEQVLFVNLSGNKKNPPTTLKMNVFFSTNDPSTDYFSFSKFESHFVKHVTDRRDPPKTNHW